MNRHIRIVVASCVLCALLLSGCTANMDERTPALISDSSLLPLAKILAQTLPAYAITTVPNSGADLFIKGNAVAGLLHTQAEPIAATSNAYYTPLCYTSVVIAVDRKQTDARLSDWSDLPDTNEKVAFYGNAGERSHMDEMLAVSYGLAGGLFA